MLVSPKSVLLALLLVLAGPASALADGRLSVRAGRQAIRARVVQEYGSAGSVRVRRCDRPTADLVECHGVIHLIAGAGERYRCHKLYRAQRMRKGIAVTESRDGRRFETFAAARCRPV